MKTVISELRRCYACGGNTYTGPDGYQNWYLNRGTPWVLCKGCYNNIIYVEKMHTNGKAYYKKNHELIRERHTHSVEFKGRTVKVGFNPRKGICEECGRKIGSSGIKRTLIFLTRT